MAATVGATLLIAAVVVAQELSPLAFQTVSRTE
jgi:hypothetical protein